MAAGELLSLRTLARHPPRRGLQGLADRLLGYGFSNQDTATLCEACNVCVPRGRLRGLGLAVLQLSKLFPDDAEVRDYWLPLVRQWFTRDPEARQSFALQPYATNAPITAFLAGVAQRLPAELSKAIFVRMLDLVADHADAERSCYVLYLSTKHLADQVESNPLMAAKIRVRDWPGAIAAMRPPKVTQPGVLESYQAALRNSIGRRKPVVQRGASERGRHAHVIPVGHASSTRTQLKEVSLRDLIAQVGAHVTVSKPTERQDGSDEDVLADIAPSAAGRRRASGLQTNIALGIARDVSDLDPLKVQRLFERLARSDLDRAEQWVFRVALTTMYCTGWPANVLTALAEGTTARYEPRPGAVLISGELIGPWPELAAGRWRCGPRSRRSSGSLLLTISVEVTRPLSVGE